MIALVKHPEQRQNFNAQFVICGLVLIAVVINNLGFVIIHDYYYT